ncbi:MAG: hypothetical protein ACYCRD_06545 [Leptospirillum sp.]
MNDLQRKATELRNQLPKNGHASPPPMKGILLGTLPHKDGEVRLVWDTFEGHSFLSIRLWTSDDGKTYWPSKVGFTIRVRDLPALGEVVGKALDLALQESRKS